MKPLKLSYNRVWRTYTGGKAIDTFYQNEIIEDGHYPEVWIASTTTAINPEVIPNEGLSFVDGTETSLLDLINEDPKSYLGEAHINNFGETTGLLVKLLDASERLTIQVHPSKEKAMELFNSQFGKTEAWYIMEGRDVDGDAPHIYFGFKEGINRDEWKVLFEEQDIEGMLNGLNKVYVKPGDVFLIEGGLPHAIGTGCFLLEIQEPTDLTIRIEKITPGGYEIPDHICHQGLGFDKMFDCFDYQGYSESEILDKWRLVDGSKPLEETTLIDYKHTKCFSLESFNVNHDMDLAEVDGYSIIVVLDGEGVLKTDDDSLIIKKGDQLFIPASLSKLVLSSTSTTSLEVIRCLPPIK